MINTQHNTVAGLFLAVPAITGMLSVADISAANPPATIQLTGVVRDFKEHTVSGGHTDFERVPDQGFGLYTGNVDIFLGSDGKPQFTGSGHIVNTQCHDNQGRPIAPHLYNKRFSSNSGSTPTMCATLRDSDGVDAYQICLTSATYNSNGTSTWNYHVKELGTGKDLSHWVLKLDQSHQVMAGTTSGYELGEHDQTELYGLKWDLTDSFTEGDFTVVLDKHYEGDNECDGALAKGGNDTDEEQLFVPVEDESTDSSPLTGDPTLVSDSDLNDQSGSIGSSSTGGIESSSSFDEWFNDVPGVNLSSCMPITLVLQPDGTYVFDDTLDPTYSSIGGFFPIDDALFGNPGGSPDHNFHFTFELHTKFTYDKNANQEFRFTGDDDVWVFVDDKLAIDLGGVHGSTDQFIDLDRMNLTDGQTYTLDFFFAERHRTQSNFRIATNIELITAKVPSVFAAFD